MSGTVAASPARRKSIRRGGALSVPEARRNRSAALLLKGSFDCPAFLG
ncbi:hypothetical protein I603_0676 [Erythrobacter dokdonensis DSW-74]|uniref:Uncharacterized protein n=1 Tax=Erythrobacter dokdonensis DSW-74 TaxID=1300349 RepID=A0A1A7BN06_9SPHN|nr:hypothetical protein I603_0676 [Erythrobacter dokdonensis DSW-74]